LRVIKSVLVNVMGMLILTFGFELIVKLLTTIPKDNRSIKMLIYKDYNLRVEILFSIYLVFTLLTFILFINLTVYLNSKLKNNYEGL